MRKRRNINLLIPLCFLSFLGLAYLIIFTNPMSEIQLFNLQDILPGQTVLIPFFLSVFLFIFSFFTLLFKSKRRGFFIAAFAVSYLMLRLQNLTQTFFLILLLAVFLTLEFVFVKQK
ncbi:MAG: hypothetical protein M1450_03000 [Patescibacteria group bacterium]|nr:hypothetical protein [Patescibacteria group bacterium]